MPVLDFATAVDILADPNAQKIVEVWPKVGKGESRDTEPGLQPWKAILTGVVIRVGECKAEISSSTLPNEQGNKREIAFEQVRYFA